MRFIPFQRRTLIALAACAIALPALAQEQAERKEKKDSKWSALLNVDLMVDTYTGFLARKYDLTEEQAGFTKQLLRQKASEFMATNGDEVRDLVDRLFDVRTGADMPAAELTQWGQRAMPLYDQAKKLIVDGNQQWREILNDQQKAIHDEDLKLMQESFGTTEEQLNRIVSGEMTVEEFRRPPRLNKGTSKRARRGRNQNPPQVAQAEPQAMPVEPGNPGVQPAQAATGTTVDPNAANGQPVTVAKPAEGDPNAHPVQQDPGTQEQPEDPDEVQPQDQQPVPDQQPHEIDPAAQQQVEQEQPPMPEQQPHDEPAPDQRPDARPRDRGRPGGSGSLDYEGKWDAYTRDFIARYGLDAAQTQKAWDILKSCKEQAAQYLKGRAAQLKEIEERQGALSSAARQPKSGGENDAKTAASDANDRSKKQNEINELRTKLTAPLDQIFEKQLKPRLDQLPTRAQRKVAEAGGSRPNRSASDAKAPAAGAGAQNGRRKVDNAGSGAGGGAKTASEPPKGGG